MHNSVSKRNAYQLLLMQNSLSSMSKIGISGSGKLKSADGLTGNDDNLPQDISYSKKKCQQSEGTPFFFSQVKDELYYISDAFRPII